MQPRAVAFLIMTVGISAITLAVTADLLGMGAQTGFGNKQAAVAAVGTALMLLAAFVHQQQSSLRLRPLFALCILGLAFGSAVFDYASRIQRGRHFYQTADWLISYAGGFVRRGLFGQLFLEVAPTGAAGLWLLFAIQVSCYALVLLYVVQFLRREDYSWSSIALCCGPAALPFIGWDTGGAFRKEILVFAVLVLLAWSRSPARRPGSQRALVFTALLLWIVTVFSWEPTAAVLPAVVYLLWFDGGGRTCGAVRRTAVVLFVVVAAVGLGASVLAQGNIETSNSACAAIRAHGLGAPTLCDGAIAAVGWSGAASRIALLEQYPLYVGYLPLTSLAVIPILAAAWSGRNRKWIVASAGAVLPLYVVAIDYGRWAHVLVMAVAICIMASAARDAESRVWTPLATVLYVSLWGIPHWLEASRSEWPWLGLLATLMRFAVDLGGS